MVRSLNLYVSLSEGTDPDVAEADGGAGVAVRLKADRAIAVNNCTGEADELGCAEDFGVVLEKNTVLDNCHIGTVEVCAVFLEYGSGVDDVVYVPLAGFTHGVDQRRSLFVETACHAVYICLVVVAVKNLYFVFVLKEYATVAASLARAFDAFGHSPFEVELETTEGLLCDDVTFTFVNGHDAVFHGPLSVLSVVVAPSREVFAIEEYDGVARNFSRAVFAGGYNLGLGGPVFRHGRTHGFGIRVLFCILSVCCDAANECCKS